MKQFLVMFVLFCVTFPAYAQEGTGLTQAEEKRLMSYSGFNFNKARRKMVDGEKMLARTFPQRLQDHELFLRALLEDRLENLSQLAHGCLMFIDIGPALGNSQHPGITMLPIADILEKSGDGNVVVGIDLPEEVEAFKKNVQKNPQLKKPLDRQAIYLLGADGKSDLAKLINGRVHDATGRALPSLDSTYFVVIRTANAIDLYATWPQSKKWLVANARSLAKNHVLLFFNREVMFKPAGQTQWSIIARLSERGFRHNSRNTKLAKGEKPYVVYKKELAKLAPIPGVLVAAANDFMPFSKSDASASSPPKAKTPPSAPVAVPIVTKKAPPKASPPKTKPVAPKPTEVNPEADDGVASALEKQRQEKVTDLLVKVNILETKLAERQEKIKTLKTQLTNARAIAEANKRGDGKIVERLQKQLAEVKNNALVLRSALAEAKAQQEKDANSNSQLENELKESRDKIQDLTARLQTSATATAQLQAKEQEVAELAQQLEQAKQEVGGLQEKLAEAQTEPAPELPPPPKVKKPKVATGKKVEKKVVAKKPGSGSVIYDLSDLPSGAVCLPGTDRHGRSMCVIQEMEVDDIIK
ncbi:MAG: hypothetical protein Q8M83_06275 [bacterium]|nr:hypothetical protein [bacterium]